MKKINIVLVLVMLLSLGISTVMMAQTHKKKKKKKHKTEQSTAEADSIAAAQTRDSLARIAAATPAAEPVDTTHQLTDGLVADTSSFLNLASIELDTTKPVDGLYRAPLLTRAKPFAFPKENKYDTKFYKRIWRTIDLNDSVNKIFSMPGQTLMALIMDAIKAQKLVAYYDEGFTKALTYEKVLRVMSDSVVVPDIDSTGTQFGSHMIYVPFNPDSVTTLEIKEDLYVDKVRGRMITQIIGMSPLKKVKGSTGEYLGDQHPFYLYFPQCRNVFATKDVYDTQRDVYGLSFDDLFIERDFKSTIVKESNPGDLRIKDKFPNDEKRQKQESDRIEKEIRDYKNNLWKY